MSENYVIPALEKTFEILDYMSTAEDGVSLSEISKALRIPKTTVFRIMATMQQWNYVEKTFEQEKYRLGKALIKMGQHAAADVDMREIALPHINKLAKETGESTNLGILYEAAALTLANAKGEDFYLISRLIPTSALNCSSMGKLFLSEFTAEELEEYFQSEKPEKRTIHSVTTLEGYLELKKEIQRDGIAYDKEEYEYGLTCIGAPIRNKEDAIVAAISISGPTSRLQHKGEDTLIQKLLVTSRKISAEYQELF